MESIPYHQRLWEAQRAYNKERTPERTLKKSMQNFQHRDSRRSNGQGWTSSQGSRTVKPITQDNQVSRFKEKGRLTNASQSESAQHKFSQSKEGSFA